jgi:DNA mismatch repair protein MutL
MVGKYPGCVLHLEVNPALADVNVHPAKLEVRFANEHEIFEAVYYAAKNSLAKVDERPTFDLKENKTATGFSQNKASLSGEQRGDLPQVFAQTRLNTSITRLEDVSSGEVKNEDEQMRLIMRTTPLQPEREETQAVYNTVRAVYEPISHGTFNNVNIDIEVEPDDGAENKNISTDYKKSESKNSAEADSTEGIIVLGQCFGTYIMAQKGDSLWIIDKHAAHERILYEKVKKQRKASSQVLLEPVTVTLPAEEYAAAVENFELLEQAGITAEDFGGSTLLVREAPLELSGQDIPALVSETAGLLLAHKKDITPARLDWIFHSVACRAAIKARDRTTLPEMQSLAETVLCSNDILYCPHGRPVAFELPRRDIEKKFGR